MAEFDLIAALARVLNLSPRLARAVLQVESAAGYIPSWQGRMIIRFEAHIFRQELSNDPLFATHFLLGEPTWLTHYYRTAADAPWQHYHGDQRTEWAALELAMSMNRETALRATGMGVAQIMGFNHLAVGYPTAAAMFEDYAAPGEAEEVTGFFAFVARTPGALPALQQGDLTRFAAIYNGPANADEYARRMRAALNA